MVPSQQYSCVDQVVLYRDRGGHSILLSNWYKNTTKLLDIGYAFTIRNITNVSSCHVDSNANNFNFNFTLCLYFRYKRVPRPLKKRGLALTGVNTFTLIS